MCAGPPMMHLRGKAEGVFARSANGCGFMPRSDGIDAQTNQQIPPLRCGMTTLKRAGPRKRARPQKERGREISIQNSEGPAP